MPYRKLLAVDSSTTYLQMGLQIGTGRMVRNIDVGLKHGEYLMPQVQSFLVEAGITPSELDGLICSRGPGSFTGLRIGMAAFKAMSRALDIPMVSLSTLDSIALHYRKYNSLILPAIDARGGKSYTRPYDFRRSSMDVGVTELGMILKKGIIGPVLDTGPQELYDYLPSILFPDQQLLLTKSEATAFHSHNYSTLDSHASVCDANQIDMVVSECMYLLLTGSHGMALHRSLPDSWTYSPLSPTYQSKSHQHTLELSVLYQDSVPWIEDMLDYGREVLEGGGHDDPDQGPTYIRSGVGH